MPVDILHLTKDIKHFPRAPCTGRSSEENMKSNWTNIKIFTDAASSIIFGHENPIEHYQNHKLCIKSENDAGSCYGTSLMCRVVFAENQMLYWLCQQHNVNWCSAGHWSERSRSPPLEALRCLPLNLHKLTRSTLCTTKVLNEKPTN